MKRKIITVEDVKKAMQEIGFEDYLNRFDEIGIRDTSVLRSNRKKNIQVKEDAPGLEGGTDEQMKNEKVSQEGVESDAEKDEPEVLSDIDIEEEKPENEPDQQENLADEINTS